MICEKAESDILIEVFDDDWVMVNTEWRERDCAGREWRAVYQEGHRTTPESIARYATNEFVTTRDGELLVQIDHGCFRIPFELIDLLRKKNS